MHQTYKKICHPYKYLLILIILHLFPILLCLVISHVQLFATPCTVAFQAPLSIGILQARILEWVAISFSRGSYQFRDGTQASHITGRFFTV